MTSELIGRVLDVASALLHRRPFPVLISTCAVSQIPSVLDGTSEGKPQVLFCFSEEPHFPVMQCGLYGDGRRRH